MVEEGEEPALTTMEEGQQQQASEEKEPGVVDKANGEQKFAMEKEKEGEREGNGEQKIVMEKEKQGEKDANGGQKIMTDKEKHGESFGGRKGRTSSMDLDCARLGSAKKAGSTDLDTGRVVNLKKGGSAGYLRADLLNLADLDAALDKHLARGVSGNLGAPSKRKLKEWEIDPTKLILKQAIAQGTFGTVHRGEYDGQDVAVKLLDWGEEDTMSRAQIESNRNAFNQEVEVWQKLDHANVTRFIGASVGSSNLQIPSFHNGNDGFVHVASNICCVVVEYLAGGTLKDYLIRNRRRKLIFKTVIQLALDLSRGLAYLHSKKIVHRDVKTENMLLDTKRVVKIADFGVARVEASNPKDMTGETGTLGYMAPEVLNGKPYNRKCDVYSFGVCLWEIYCCDMPYPDLSFTEMTHAVVHHNLRPSIPRCCPTSLGHVMKKCWDANPEKRPEMAQVVELIEAIDTSKGGGMIPPEAQPNGCLTCIAKYRGP